VNKNRGFGHREDRRSRRPVRATGGRLGVVADDLLRGHGALDDELRREVLMRSVSADLEAVVSRRADTSADETAAHPGHHPSGYWVSGDGEDGASARRG